MYAGYLYVIAAGNETQVGKAKKALIGAIIGLIIAMAAFGIVNTVVKLEPIASPLGGAATSAELLNNQ